MRVSLFWCCWTGNDHRTSPRIAKACFWETLPKVSDTHADTDSQQWQSTMSVLRHMDQRCQLTMDPSCYAVMSATVTDIPCHQRLFSCHINHQKSSPVRDWWSTPLEWLSITRDLDFDLASAHTAYGRASLIDLYLHTKFHWNRKNFFVDRPTARTASSSGSRGTQLG